VPETIDSATQKETQMSDKDFVIDMEDDTEGHGNLGLKIVESGDADWLEERLRKDSGKSRFRITLGDEDDTEDQQHEHQRKEPELLPRGHVRPELVEERHCILKYLTSSETRWSSDIFEIS